MKTSKEKILGKLLEIEELIRIENDKDNIKKLKRQYTILNNKLKQEE